MVNSGANSGVKNSFLVGEFGFHTNDNQTCMIYIATSDLYSKLSVTAQGGEFNISGHGCLAEKFFNPIWVGKGSKPPVTEKVR